MDLDTALQQVGEGWSDLVTKWYDLVGIVRGCVNNAAIWEGEADVEVTVVEASRGMLRVAATHEDPIAQEALDKLAWAIERDSAKICEVCGEKGFRRKTLEGSPNRCQPHYIELLNRLADEGKI